MRFILTLVLFFSIGLDALAQDERDLILGSWVSEEDSNWKMVFTKDDTCNWYYEDELSSSYTYAISNTSPQCGQEVYISELTSYLSLIDVSDSTHQNCYEIYGFSEVTPGRKAVSLRWIRRGKPMLFIKEEL